MSELNAKIIEVTLLRERVTQLRTENDALERERDTMAAALRDFADHGLRCDLLPTNGHRRDADWWHKYLANADKHVRSLARAALAQADDGGRS